MLKNATITRIDTPGTPTAGGEVTFSSGAAISVRCSFTGVTRRQRYQLGAVIKEATAALRAIAEDLTAAAVSVVDGYRMNVTPDGRTLASYEVVHVIDDRKRSLNCVVAFVRKV